MNIYESLDLHRQDLERLERGVNVYGEPYEYAPKAAEFVRKVIAEYERIIAAPSINAEDMQFLFDSDCVERHMAEYREGLKLWDELREAE